MPHLYHAHRVIHKGGRKIVVYLSFTAFLEAVEVTAKFVWRHCLITLCGYRFVSSIHSCSVRSKRKNLAIF